jgi:RHS repeat-associated protein
MPYSAFGENAATGILTATSDPNLAFTRDAPTDTKLATSNPLLVYNLRFPGQYFDSESNLNYNYFRSYQPTQGRYSQSDPIGLAGGLNRFGYVEGNPLMYADPDGLLPQGVVDFGAGMGDVILFGQGQRLRDLLDVDGGIDQCSDEYSAGEWAGIGASLATGLSGGIKAAGAKGAGKEFSHWIPNRMGGPRTILNGNYVPTATHALSDPFRYRFMPSAWKMANPMPGALSQQWTRIPNVFKGTAAGGAYGAAGAAQSGCTCNR